MRKAITISILFHVGLLTWALGYFATSTKIKPITKASVPVDILTPSQFTKIKAGEKKAKKKKPAPVAKKKKVEPKKPPKVVKKAVPKPKPKPKPVKVAKPKPKPKPVKKVEKPQPKQKKPKPKKIAKPKPKPAKKKLASLKPKPKPVKRQPAKPQSQFDPENIAALLNKLPSKQSAPKSSYKVDLKPAPRSQARAERPSYGRSYGTDATMSANEIDAFKAQISQCWRPPTGGLGSRDLNVKLRIRFKPDGTLEKPPELANYSGSPFFRPAADAAQRAVWQCQPYRMPKDKFATWQDMILNFDPRDMFGG